MLKVTLYRLALAAGMLVLAQSGFAHETWLIPSHFTAATGQTIRCDLTSGMNFPRPEYAIKPERVAKAIYRLDGQQERFTTSKRRPMSLACDVAFPHPGIATVAIALKPKDIELSAEKVAEYFEEIRASPATRSAWADMPKGTPWQETYTKYAKTIINVGTTDDDSWKEAIDLDFEIVPLTDPTRLVAGASLSIRLVKAGKGLADASVGVMIAGSLKRKFYSTDASGTAVITLDRSGDTLIYAVDLTRPHSQGRWQSSFTTLTLHVAK